MNLVLHTEVLTGRHCLLDSRIGLDKIADKNQYYISKLVRESLASKFQTLMVYHDQGSVGSGVVYLRKGQGILLKVCVGA